MIHPGIDLGTTYSMIAHVNPYGQPALFPDLHDASQFRTPSVVHLGRAGALIGAAAEDLLDEVGDAPVARFMKAGLAQRDFAFPDRLGQAWSASALTALILKKLARDARAFAGEELGPGVITVPAHFTDEQRRATLTAARLAGLSDIRLVEEPVAAAVYYGQAEGAVDRTLLVYDFGGGTFDVSVLQVASEGLFVLATDGDAQLGGRVIDEGLMAVVDAEFHRRHGESALADRVASQRLRRLCEEAKIALSRGAGAHIRRSVLLKDRPCEFSLTRSDLEPFVAMALERSLAACERCLAAAGLGWRELDKIMLTGGSSLLPGVREALSARWGQSPDAVVMKQPHQAVAFGAAIMADRFGRGGGDLLNVRQVAGCDLALRVWDPASRASKLEVLVPRNAPLPASHTRILQTGRADQDSLTLEFSQLRGEPAVEFSLGAFTFGPIETPRMHYPVRLTVACEADGLVHVSARDDLSGRQLELALHENGDSTDHADQHRLVNSISLAAS